MIASGASTAVGTRPFAVTVLALAAIAGGVGAGVAMWYAAAPGEAGRGVAMHVLAALAARAAARAGGGAGAELDLVVVLAVAMPGCGPALAWLLSVGRGGRPVHNAHAAFEDAERRQSPRARGPRLERELGVVSHAQVLQHGSLEEKRNLLRRIARLGNRRYLTLLRQFLRDPEPELRLCAYAELARLCQVQEEAIGRLRARVEAQQDAMAAVQAVAIGELAEANRTYATSGLLDADMAEYWLRQAGQLAERAMAIDATCVVAQRALALTLAELGDLSRAWSIAVAWPPAADTPLVLARAEVAFLRRDRTVCRAAGELLRARNQPLPPWLEAVIGTASPAPAAAPALPAAAPQDDVDAELPLRDFAGDGRSLLLPMVGDDAAMGREELA